MKNRYSEEFKNLTSRQKEVLEKMVEGLSYIEIAKALYISPETVKSHKKSLYKKLKVKNQIAAVKVYFLNTMQERVGVQ